MNPDQQIELYRVARSIAWSYRLQDYSEAALKDMQRVVDKSRESIVRKFADGLGQEGSYTRQHFQNNLKELERLSLGLRNQLGEQLTASTSRIGSLALREWGENLSVGGVAKMVNTVALSPEQFSAFFRRNPPAGLLIPKVMRNAMNQGVIKRVEGELLDVLREGALTGQSYKRIVDRLGSSFTDFNRVQLTTLTRTFFQTANAQAFDAVYAANQDIVEGKIWTNVNDDRVCLLCLPLGEVLYRKGESHPPMPRHPNCRCVFRAKTVSYRDLGIDLDELEEVAAPVVTRGYFVPAKTDVLLRPTKVTDLMMRPEGDYNTAALMEQTSHRLASNWNITPEALETYINEEGLRFGKDVAFDVKKQQTLKALLEEWGGSSGSMPSQHMLAHINRKLGLEFDMTQDMLDFDSWVRSKPDLSRALTSLADTMYLETQQWFRERGISAVHLYRVGDRGTNKAFTSWSYTRGGVRAQVGREVIEEIIPVGHIFSTPATGFGTLMESEMVVLSRTVSKTSSLRPGKWVIPPAGTGTGRRPQSVSFYKGGMKEAFPDLPEAQQKAMLGVGRYNMYKAGELTLDQLVDPVTGEMYLLRELQAGEHLDRSGVPDRFDISSVHPTSAHRKFVEENRQDQWDRVKQNFTIDEFEEIKQYAQEKLEQVTSNSFPVIRVDHNVVLRSILNDGRIKSQFETGTSGGFLGNSTRASFEKRFFDYAEDMDAKQRPIYGTLTEDSGRTGALQYGPVQIVLKEEVKHRITFTSRDSLSYGEADILPSPLLNPELDSLYLRNLGVARTKSAAKRIIDSELSLDMFSDSGYVEIQVHGGISLDDIEGVLFDNGIVPKQDILDLLDSKGIIYQLLEN